MNNLGLLYLNGTGVQRDINLARTWLERAISLNNAEAQENLKRLEQAALLDGAHVTARRASCMQTCSTLQRSYVDSICEPYSADDDQPERTKCVGMSLTLAQRCRGSCREWAPASLGDNKCVTCFQTLTACSIGKGPPASQGNGKPYAVDSNACLVEYVYCTANCRGERAPMPEAPSATRE